MCIKNPVSLQYTLSRFLGAWYSFLLFDVDIHDASLLYEKPGWEYSNVTIACIIAFNNTFVVVYLTTGAQ